MEKIISEVSAFEKSVLRKSSVVLSMFLDFQHSPDMLFNIKIFNFNKKSSRQIKEIWIFFLNFAL